MYGVFLGQLFDFGILHVFYCFVCLTLVGLIVKKCGK